MSAFQFDLHTHTTYSDGWDWRAMAETASAHGLDGIGFTDHCPIVSDPFGRRARYDFSETYLERRASFDAAREEVDVRIIDGAEVNYDPRAEEAIASFLADADFEYTIGSVHTTDAVHVPNPDLADADRSTRRAVIDRYVDWQVALIESELFDILGHLDLPQRTDHLHDLMTATDHERLADALANHVTVPELNAGRLDRSLATVHPDPAYLDIYADRGVSFVLGTDSHAPDQLASRIPLLKALLPDLPVDVRPLPPCLDVISEEGAAGRTPLD